MKNAQPHALFEELQAFDPSWAEHYDTLLEAAVAACALPVYYAYLHTIEGRRYQIRILQTAVHDRLSDQQVS